ncbi:hypothetical protein [Pseudomonas syringae]|uniref:hypothetical protein n=1 Tax=Pseudomonas syringae TaxID=317 RepID=UPI0018754046|nr:hypothetical protein [Pseudomonas syringae]
MSRQFDQEIADARQVHHLINECLASGRDPQRSAIEQASDETVGAGDDPGFHEAVCHVIESIEVPLPQEVFELLMVSLVQSITHCRNSTFQ